MQIKLPDGFIEVIGRATGDAELKIVGEKQTPMCTFSLAVGKNPDTTTKFANCKAWRNDALYAAGIKKGCSVRAAGKVEEREYNGKQYKTLTCEWLNFVPQMDAASIPVTPPAQKTTPAENTLKEVDAGDDLPF